MRRRGLRNGIPGAVAVVVFISVLTAAAPGVAGASGRSPGRAHVGTHYGIDRPVCSQPAPGHAACLAVKLDRVSKGTPGAHAYRVRAAYDTGPAGGYTPSDLATAYSYAPDATTGASQTVAIVDAFSDPNARADLDTFDENYGLPDETATSLRILNQDGAASPLPAADSEWSLEQSLDLDIVRGVCHQCKVLLIEASTDSDADLGAAVATAVRLGATEVSNSYGLGELTSDSSSSVAAAAAAYDVPGVVITASAGDFGWHDFDLINPIPANLPSDGPQSPASLPSVIAVGGTTLTLDATNHRLAETVWNEDGSDDGVGWNSASDNNATGGGCSIHYQAPVWQKAVTGWNATGCGDMRLSADVAVDGDPATGYDLYDSYSQPGWETIAGTSMGSPLVAALYALAGGAHGDEYPAVALYDHFAKSDSAFYDVTSGGNSYCDGDDPASCAANGPLTEYPGGTSNPNGTAFGTVDCAFEPNPSTDGTPVTNTTQCNAASGFDGPSGVGVPNGIGSVTAIAPKVAIALPAMLRLHSSRVFTASTTDSMAGGSTRTYTWTWGDGTAASHGSGPHHTFSTAGVYRITVKLVDGSFRTASATRVITIGKALSVSARAPKRIKAGHRGAFTARATDPNTGGRIASYKWTFGDGHRATGAHVKHAYSRPGHYKVRVAVTDTTGVVTRKSVTVRVHHS